MGNCLGSDPEPEKTSDAEGKSPQAQAGTVTRDLGGTASVGSFSKSKPAAAAAASSDAE